MRGNNDLCNRPLTTSLTMNSVKHFDKVVAAKLDECRTAGEMLAVLHKEFDLSQPIGFASKLAFRAGLRTAVNMIQPPIRNAYDV